MPRLLPCFYLLLAAFTAQGQTSLSYYLPAAVTYNKQVPTPAAVLGYEVGEWHVSHDQLVGYMKAVDAVSDRISLAEYGRTHENRPLLLLTVTSPDNHRHLDQIRADHKKLSNPRLSDKLDLAAMPAVIWMGYSVHGNEQSGTNAALLAVYHLAAAEGPAVEKLLQQTVILLEPSINPDGMSRFAGWVNAHRGKNLVADPNNLEQNEAWPTGRSNHYWFDLNRDWLPLQHPESRGRLVKYHEWMPNVLTDHHEMSTNSTFFFQPGVPARKHPLTPESNYQLTKKIGAFHAKALDQIGSLYFTEENYDDFYYGKGSTYPDIHGGAGILFEQASSRSHAQESVNGVLRFPFTIRNQFITTLSSLEAVQALRTELLAYQRDFYKQTLAEARRQPVRAYVFGSEKDPARVFHLAEILRQHQVELYHPKTAITANGRTFRPGEAYLVPTDQPQFKVIQAMFEVRTQFADSLFYDISAWNFLHAFSLDHAALTQLNAGGLGEKLTAPVFPAGQVIGGESSYAYAFEWHGYYAPRALHTLLEKKLHLKVASAPFYLSADKKMDYGTVMIPVSLQPLPAGELYQLLQSVARENGRTMYAVQPGLSPKGLNLGSVNFLPLRKPEVLLLAGAGVTSTDVGEAWHLLDNRFNIPASLVAPARIDHIALDRYTVIVMGDGNYAAIGSQGREKLRDWLQRGNTLIAIGSGARWLADAGLSTTQFDKPAAQETPAQQQPYASMANLAGAQAITGAIFHARLDLTHPLAYGYEREELYVFRDHNLFMSRSKGPFSNPLMYTAQPLASGYISRGNENRLRSTPAADIAQVGAGRIISLADNPNFRAFWYGTNKLFLNSIFFGHLIKS
jgi:hypothetical protein